MKLFKFDNDVKGSSGKCGYCNYETLEVYLTEGTKKEAEQMLKTWRKDGGNGFCGNWMCDIMINDNSEILAFRTLKVRLKQKEVEQILKGEIIVWADDIEDVQISMEKEKW